jgi:hypothetical protein
LSVETVITWKSPRPRATLASSASAGISSRQGLQVFVQKFTTTVLPRKLESLTGRPSMSGSSKSGASRFLPA